MNTERKGMINSISSLDVVLAVYIRSAEWRRGLNFISEDKDAIQTGLWQYDRGKKLGPHRHVGNMRNIDRTQEVIFVKSGSLRVSIYSESEELVEKLILNAGDLVILLSGGHGYEVLENETQVLEVKNGPYTGLDDRIPFHEDTLEPKGD